MASFAATGMARLMGGGPVPLKGDDEGWFWGVLGRRGGGGAAGVPEDWRCGVPGRG
jgi:hypothetical protein